MDLSSISAAVSSLKAATEIAKSLIELKSAEDIRSKVIELQAQILAAQDSALDAKIQCVEFAEKNILQGQEIRQLRDQIQLREVMKYRYDVYWRQNKDGSAEGPFCPKCFDGRQTPSRMANRANDDFWRCPVCGYILEKPGRAGRGAARAVTDWDPLA